MPDKLNEGGKQRQSKADVSKVDKNDRLPIKFYEALSYIHFNR